MGLIALAVIAVFVTGFALHGKGNPSVPLSVGTPAPLPSPTNHALFVTPPEGAVALFVGDSYTLGTGASTPNNSWAQLVADGYGWDATFEAVGGTGFTWGGGADGGAGDTINERLQRVVDAGEIEPEVVVLQGGQNDWRASPIELRTAVMKAAAISKQAWPDADVILFGPAAPQPLGKSIERMDTAVEGGALSAGAYSINPGRSNWFTDENSSKYDFDKAHVNDAGHELIWQQFVAALRAFEAGDQRSP